MDAWAASLFLYFCMRNNSSPDQCFTYPAIWRRIATNTVQQDAVKLEQQIEVEGTFPELSFGGLQCSTIVDDLLDVLTFRLSPYLRAASNFNTSPSVAWVPSMREERTAS